MVAVMLPASAHRCMPRAVSQVRNQADIGIRRPRSGLLRVGGKAPDDTSP